MSRGHDPQSNRQSCRFFRSTLFGTLGFSIVVPFMVFLVAKWGGNAIVYGAAASTYSAFQLIGAPILGRLSDRIGRRKVLLASQLGTLLSWMIFLIAFAVPAYALVKVDSALLGEFTVTLPLIILFFARAIDGLTGGNVSVANAYLADITDDRSRAQNFGRMALSTNLGFIIGPALAGLLGATLLGEILPVFAALLVSLVASFMIAFGLKEGRSQSLNTKPGLPNACKVFGQETKECYALRGTDEITTAAILRLPRMPALLFVNFLVMLGFSFFYIAFPTHAALGLRWSVTDTGAYFAVLSLFMALVQGPLLGRLSKVVPARAVIVGGSLALSVGFSLLQWDNTVLLYVAAALIALGNGLMWPTFMALSCATGRGAVSRCGTRVRKQLRRCCEHHRIDCWRVIVHSDRLFGVYRLCRHHRDRHYRNGICLFKRCGCRIIHRRVNVHGFVGCWQFNRVRIIQSSSLLRCTRLLKLLIFAAIADLHSLISFSVVQQN